MKFAFFMTLSLLFAAVAVYAADTNPVKGSHLENALACVDCHGTPEPQKRASAKTCIECHGDMTDGVETEFTNATGAPYKMNIHNTHASPLRCTLCHSSHGESKLYCKTCHHTFKIDVP